ncbi:hypothetical protein D3C75_881760 [compost metagenome]
MGDRLRLVLNDLASDQHRFNDGSNSGIAIARSQVVEVGRAGPFAFIVLGAVGMNKRWQCHQAAHFLCRVAGEAQARVGDVRGHSPLIVVSGEQDDGVRLAFANRLGHRQKVAGVEGH